LNLAAIGIAQCYGDQPGRDETMLAYFDSWQAVAWAGVLVIVALLAVAVHHLRRQKQHLTAAFEHMQQGLCVYDHAERLLFCNKRYIEMYGFSPDIVRPGSTLLDVLEQRVALGTLMGSAVAYRDNVIAALRAGKTIQSLVKSGDGQMISVINKPMPDGGWIGTHEDVTEQRRLEKEPADMAAPETPPHGHRRRHLGLPRAHGQAAQDRRRQRRCDEGNRHHAFGLVRRDLAARRGRSAGIERGLLEHQDRRG